MDMEPGIRPVRIENAILCYVNKLVLKKTKKEANAVWGSKELCTDLEARIEGGLHLFLEMA